MRGQKRTIFYLGLVLFAACVLAVLLFWGLRNPTGAHNPDITLGSAVVLCVFVSMLLCAVPLFISYVQTTAKDRQLNKLSSLDGHEIAATTYYKIAVSTFKSIQPARVEDPDYRLPILSFCITVIFGCLMVFLGGFPEVTSLFQRSTFLLGGMNILTETDLDKIAIYQKGTLLVGSVAFLGSYIYMLGSILERINNNDIYPISYYYYVVRFAVAALLAMIVRHVFTLIYDQPAAILLIAFAIGFVPDQFITSLLRQAFKFARIVGTQNDPDQKALPTNMSLLMIEGLTRQKIDRLNELDIDNAQILAEQNPLIIWPRLPYSLTLLVDWIAQAQLYCLVREVGVMQLRAKGIGNIYDLHTALSDKNSAADIASVAGLVPTAVPAYIANLDADPSFRHLREVRSAL